jgi:hypothetical protein
LSDNEEHAELQLHMAEVDATATWAHSPKDDRRNCHGLLVNGGTLGKIHQWEPVSNGKNEVIITSGTWVSILMMRRLLLGVVKA